MRKKTKTDKNKKRSVVFSPNTLEQLDKLAQRKNVYTSDIIRELVEKGLSVTGYQDDIGLISNIVRQEVKVEIQKQADRLAAMVFKVGAMAASGYYLTGKALSEVISPSFTKTYKDIERVARREGIDFMNMKVGEIINHLNDDEAVSEKMDKLTDRN